jgi:molybdopterin-containing oxidoreductase family membrane subunit
MFIFANYIGVLVPMAILFFKKLRSIKTITFAAIIAIVGLWFNRYIIIVPTLETPYLPIQDTRPEYLHYTATWIEWSLSFAGVAAFILMFILLMRLVPIIPMSGIIDHEREHNRKNKMQTQN